MTVAVRLCDIPARVRLAAVPPAVANEPDPGKRQAILTAALFPSDQVYLLTDEARALVERWERAA